MESASMMMTVFPSTETPPGTRWHNGASETVTDAVVVPFARRHCRFDDPFAHVKGLEDDWDGYGALKPFPRAVEVTEQLWLSLSRRYKLPVPAVMATSDGGVYLEWVTQNAMLIVEFEPDGTIDMSAETSTFSVDGALKEYQDQFWQTLRAL